MSPASSWTEAAPWSRTPCCTSPAARTAAGVSPAAPCASLETSTSVGTSTSATPGARAPVDPWAEALVFYSVDILVVMTSCRKDDLILKG